MSPLMTPSSLSLPGVQWLGSALVRAAQPALPALKTSPRHDISCQTQGFAMKAARLSTKATIGKEEGRRSWRWPLAFCLALAVAISLFHDLPALAGRGDPSPIPLAVASSTSAPVQAPESQSPGHGCHCLCHITAQSIASPVVTPVVFNEPLYLPPQGVPTRSCAGLPPFRPPRV
jgi:hypothetical protein